VLKLVYAVFINAGGPKLAQGLISQFELKKIEELRAELDAEFRPTHCPETTPVSFCHFSSPLTSNS
jgi:hypothetical protein